MPPSKKQYKGKGKGRKGVSAAAVVRIVKGLAEKKYTDVPFTFSDPTATSASFQTWTRVPLLVGGVAPANAVAVAAGVNGRVGNKTRILGLYITAQCDMQFSFLGGTPNVVSSYFAYFYPNGVQIRVAVVLDKESNGDSPAADFIWDAQGSPSTPELYWPRNHDFAQRFRILGYHDMYMSPGAICPCSMRKYFKLNHEMEYKGTGATDSDLWKNAISLWVVANCDRTADVYPNNNAAGAGACFALNFNCRSTYVDI